MTDQNQRNDPFFDFINSALDMGGVDGVSFETVAFAMREVIKNLPAENNGDMWHGELDRLQATLRLCLSIETIGRLMQDNPRFAQLDAQDMDLIVNLSITLAFICYNRLSERFGFENPQTTQALDGTTQLWVMLRSAKGWVDKAAADGDPVARKMSGDILRALSDVPPHNWANNTKTLSE
jgi:hypothetical protein